VRREIWLNDPPATSRKATVLPTKMTEMSSRKDARVVTFFLIIRGIFYFMRITKLKICLRESNASEITGNNLFQYFATAIECKGQYYYQVGDEILEIAQLEYERVIANPYLYYFSTALKLHFVIQNKLQMFNPLTMS
jgi:hypothetical protein